MKTTIISGEDNPSWLQDGSPQLEGGINSGVGNPFQQGDAEPSGGRPRQLGPSKSRRRRSYDDSDDDNIEDCCCCPQDPCLIGLAIFHFLSGVLGFAAVCANAYHITKQIEGGNRYLDIIQRCYVIGFSAIIILTETDWKFLMRRLKLLDLWVFRGFFYVYVGLNTLDLFTPTVETPECIIGFALILCGAMYVVMGALCLKSVALSRRKAGGQYKEILDPGEGVESV